jgi:antirestriction protein ArdC
MTTSKAKKTYIKKDVYQDVTNRIIAALEGGTAPWVKPWKEGEKQTGCDLLPSNAISGNNYRGINTMLLWSGQAENGYQSNSWVTFKQAGELGGNVIKGEKSTPIIYFQMLKRKDPVTGEPVTIPMLKQYYVFNLEQCENITSKKVKIPEVLEIGYTNALDFATRTGADIKHGGNEAFFSPSHDFVRMPAQEQFDSLEAYDGTLLHELTHWTGHKSRLERAFGARFGNEAYAFEELVAEIGSAFLCGQLNVNHTGLQHSNYLASWLKVLKADKKAIFKASTLAQKASEYLIEQATAIQLSKAA